MAEHGLGTEAYTLVEMNNGKKYAYFTQGWGKFGEDEISSSIEMGKQILHAFELDTGKVIGLSMQNVVTTEKIVYADADEKVLGYMGITK